MDTYRGFAYYSSGPDRITVEIPVHTEDGERQVIAEMLEEEFRVLAAELEAGNPVTVAGRKLVGRNR